MRAVTDGVRRRRGYIAKGSVPVYSCRDVQRTITIVYPEGDSLEIGHDLRVNQLVDLNGNPLPLPLPSARMIVYRVWKVATRAERHSEDVFYHLELVTRPELESTSVRGE
jgi:hypothetical protein